MFNLGVSGLSSGAGADRNDKWEFVYSGLCLNRGVFLSGVCSKGIDLLCKRGQDSVVKERIKVRC